MGIGISSGSYYDDAHHRAAAAWDDKYDENIVVPHPTGDINDISPDKMMGDKQIATDPGNIYDDSGNIVDYKPNGEWGQSDLPTLKPMSNEKKIYLNNEPSPLDEQGSLGSNIVPVMDKANRFGLYDPKVGYTDYYNYDSNPNNKGPKGYDYDYQSFFKANPDAKMSPGQHYPDTYKKPNHPTFSDESQYNGIGYWNPKTGNEDKTQGGHWDKDDEGHDTFTPGKTNFDHHSVEELQEYFKRVEPKAKLLLPQSKLDSLIVPVSDIKTYGLNPMIDVPEGTLPVVGGGKGPEKIKSAALQIGKDTIEGGNHGLAFEKWMNANPNQMPKDFKDGFTTTHGRFVSREEAMDIAKKNDQLHPSVKAAIAKLNAANDDSTMLLSEDLQ